MTDVAWPSVASTQCMACGRRRVVCTWFPDAECLCADCQHLPSRAERFTPVLEGTE